MGLLSNNLYSKASGPVLKFWQSLLKYIDHKIDAFQIFCTIFHSPNLITADKNFLDPVRFKQLNNNIYRLSSWVVDLGSNQNSYSFWLSAATL